MLTGFYKESDYRGTFPAIRSSYVYLESKKNVPPICEKWGVDVMCSDKNKLGKNTVVKAAGLTVKDLQDIVGSNPSMDVHLCLSV